MRRSDAPYLVLGVAVAVQRRAQTAVLLGAQVATEVAAPTAFAWRSPLAGPVRRYAAGAAAKMTREGEGVAQRLRELVTAAVEQRMRSLGDGLLRSGLGEEVVERSLSTGVFEQLMTVVIHHPATEALVSDAVEDPAVNRLVAQILDSRLVDELTAQLLASDEMQLILEHVTRSPQLRSALSEQTAGLAGDMAAGMRSRTVVADASAERFARSLIPRRPRLNGT